LNTHPKSEGFDIVFRPYSGKILVRVVAGTPPVAGLQPSGKSNREPLAESNH